MQMIRSIVTVGGLTMLSRLLGFLRDILIARYLGTGPVADAFFVALRFPNLFRRLFAEGAFNSAFVPMFAGRMESEGPAAARAFAERALSVLLAWLFLFVAAAQVAMPWLMRGIAPGFVDEPAKFADAVQFAQVTFPYLLFMSLTALQGGLLNSLHRFAHAAAAPVLLNIVLCGALVLIVPQAERPGLVLAWGVALAGIGQFLWLAIAGARAGYALGLPRPRLSPDVRRLIKLMIPGMVSGGVTQINLLVDTIVATTIGGAVSYLYYADRVYQLPLGVIGAAVGVVLLPTLTRNLKADRPDLAMHSLNRCLEFSMALILPAAAALIALPEPIMQVLFQRGAFLAADSAAAAAALIAFAAGLPAFALIKAFAPCFFAREDTITPFRFALVSVALNIALCLILAKLVGFVGIAAATSIASTVNALLLGIALRRRGFLTLDQRLLTRLPRILLAALAMGGGLYGGARLLAPLFQRYDELSILALAGLVVGGLALYGLVGLALRAFTLGDFKGALRRQRS